MTLEHEAYFYRTIYAAIHVSPNGGQRINFFKDEDKALVSAESLVENIKKSGRRGHKVVLTPLDYCHRRNRIMSENTITNDSKVLYGGDNE